MARKRKPRLTPLQQAFVRAYVRSEDPQVRGHATAAYKAAGGKARADATIWVCACELLRNPKVQAEIETAHLLADAETLLRLVDWKRAAIEAQPTLLQLALGKLPEGQPIGDAVEAARGHVILGALKEIMDRGFPKQLYLRVDAKDTLARLLQIPREELPAHVDEEA